MASTGKCAVAAGFIIFRQLQSQVEYLLLQASNGDHHWTPPKGHVDPGESEFETALRETEEEAGIKQDQMEVMKEFKKTLNYNAFGKPKCVIYWLAKLRNPNDPVILSDEHQDLKWLGIDAACELAKFPDMIETLKEANTFLSQKYGS